MKIEHEDFRRSDRFLLGTAKDTWNGDICPVWLENGAALAYRHQDADRTQFRRVDTRSGKITPLFDHAVMAERLAGCLDQTVEADRLPIEAITAVDGQVFTLQCGGKTLVCDLAAGEAKAQPADAPDGAPPSLAPAGGHEVHLRDHNLWLKTPDGGETAVTTGGVAHHGFGESPQSNLAFVTLQRMGRKAPPAIHWSTDGKRFLYHRLNELHVGTLNVLQSIPDDGGFRPRLHSYRYDMVGEKGAVAEHFIYDLATGRSVEIDYRPIGATLAAPIQSGGTWWSAAGDKVYLLDLSRHRKRVRLVEADASSGETRVLIEEHARGSLLPSWCVIASPSIRILKTGDIIWYSERSGWGHFYLYDGATGALKTAITSGEWLARDILHIDEDNGFLYFTASGREPADDVYSVKAYRAKLDGGGIALLTPEPGMHVFATESRAIGYPMAIKVTPAFAPDGSCFIDRIGGVDSLATWVLRAADGGKVVDLAAEDASPLPPFTMPEPFTVRSADGAWDLHGALLKPADFDPGKSYPVIDNIYPGPQVMRLPDSLTGNGFRSALFGEAQAFADLGFIVMLFEGRGNIGRSKSFRDLSYGEMSKASSIEDHAFALQQLAKERPYIDLQRVGVMGTSGGGFATAHALMTFPDVFKVGVSSAGNHENRGYIAFWGETYHGLHGESDYGAIFSGRLAKNLKGRLLVAHGELDDNVHLANSMRLADALIKAGKQFDMLIMPNVNHGIAGDAYFRRYSQNYMLKHLMGAELPDEPDIVPAGGYEKTEDKATAEEAPPLAQASAQE